jgi:Skp family chaperone for outer membrane proteins
MRLFSILCAVAIAAVALLATPDAIAQRNRGQSTTAVVVDYQRLAAETAIGRDMQAKLQQIRATIQTEAQALQPEQQAIETERQRLAQATRNLSAEQIRNHATYGPQYQALAERLQQFQARTQGLQGDLECSQLFALREFQRVVQPVVRGVMEQRGAGIVMDAQSTQYVAPEFDITAAVIQQLDQNQSTRTINVTRHALAECQNAGDGASGG